jgi:hypothetical protein
MKILTLRRRFYDVLNGKPWFFIGNEIKQELSNFGLFVPPIANHSGIRFG